MTLENAIPIVVLTLWGVCLVLYLEALLRMDNYVGRSFKRDREAAKKLRWHSQLEIWSLGWRKPWMIVSDGIDLYRDNMRALREPSEDAAFEYLRRRVARRVRLLFVFFACLVGAGLLVGVVVTLRSSGHL